MKTKADAQAILIEMRKAQEKVARCIDQAHRAIDPTRNAELMRTLHQATDSLNAARRALEKAAGYAIAVGSRLVALLPDAEDVAVAGRF